MTAIIIWALAQPVQAAPPERLVRIRAEPEAHVKRRARTRKKAKGTHFLGEFTIGPAWGTSFPEAPLGFGLRGTLGGGGGLAGVPLAFYGVAVFRYTRMASTIETGTLISELERELADLSAGVRMYVKLSRFRLLAEMTFGGSLVYSSAEVNGRDRFQTDHGRFAVYLAGGAQYRIHRNISFGLLSEVALPTRRPVVDFTSQVSRVTDDGGMMGWISLTATLVGHF